MWKKAVLLASMTMLLATGCRNPLVEVDEPAAETERSQQEEEPESKQLLPEPPQWNRTNHDVLTNGNTVKAIYGLRKYQNLRIEEYAYPTTGDAVAADMHNNIGRLVQLTGVIWQYDPAHPDWQDLLGGPSMYFMLGMDDGTVVEFLSLGEKGDLKPGDRLNIYGFPTGFIKYNEEGETQAMEVIGRAFEKAE